MGWIDEMPYRVDEWSRDGQKLTREIARASNFEIALAAYEVAARVYAGAMLTLRHGARVVRRNYEEAPSGGAGTLHRSSSPTPRR